MYPHPNHAYMISEIVRLTGQDAMALDFGCGAGEVVAHARSLGLNMVGADLFFDGGPEARERAIASGELGRTVFLMKNGLLPFPDRHFDIVCSNQVFEHVQDLDLALSEVRRVLKVDGIFLNIFPSSGVLRECHCGIPLAHWLNPWPQLQFAWLRCFRAFGLGYFKDGKSAGAWAADFADYLQRFTAYRSTSTIRDAYLRHGFTWERAEHRFAAYRLSLRSCPRAARLALRYPRLSGFAVSRLGSMVLVARAT